MLVGTEGPGDGDILERFDIRRKLGEGGMGVVYEAYDAQRQATVALKLMKDAAPEALYRFKNEFRSLTDINHPNLVTLFELVSAGEKWLFTMELIRGTTFQQHIRPHPESESQAALASAGGARVQTPVSAALDTATASSTMADTKSSDVLTALGTRRGRPALGPLLEDRLRAALPQLAAGIAALHDARRLHRDIKPSNVLVDTDGRVVVCDFGLVHVLTEATQHQPTGTVAAGTAVYMSPEQVDNVPLTEASDWYSFGAVLYEMLTGRPPFVGTRRDILMRKCSADPEPVLGRTPTAPSDLAQLCDSLVRRSPSERAGRAGILEALGMASEAAVAPAFHRASTASIFVGREHELSQLRAAHERSSAGEASTVMLSGPSGVGKSAIVRRYFGELSASQRDVILTGRCYQRESVPYKAFDNVVDALADHLLSLPASDAEALLPADLRPLAQLFPVLRRVDAIEMKTAIPAEIPEAHELRRRAFDGLRQLLHRICADHSVVISIDDLQWGDADSGHLLLALMRPPSPPPILLVATYRDADRSSSPLLAMLLDGAESLTHVELAIAPLDADATLELAASLSDSPAQSRQIAAEAAGNPFYVSELARYLSSGADDLTDVSLESALGWRIARLSPDERGLLSIISVAGHPIPLELAVQAAGLEGDPRKAAAKLRAEHLVRVVGAAGDGQLETYHDRVRETAVGAMPQAERLIWHRQLAECYELRGDADPELVLEHWLGAQDNARAAHYAELGARQADDAVAFDGAVRLYRLALELGPPQDRRDGLWLKLGDALVNLGRGAEAAKIYIECADRASPDEALELRRRAAHQWLITGHVDRGLETVQKVLDVIGTKLAPTPTRALASLLWTRMWLRLRGMGFRERAASEIAPQELRRLDILWTVGAGLTLIDHIRATDFQARYFRDCLRIGEPKRMAIGFTLEAALSSSGGSATTKRTGRLLKEARALRERVDDPQVGAFVTLVMGISSFCNGRWAEALRHCTEAEAALRDDCTGVTWELEAARWFGEGALFFLGELSRMATVVPVHLRDVESRGNLHASTNVRTWLTNSAWLVSDDPDQAQSQIHIAEREWSQAGFHLQHHYALLAQVQLDLYLSRPEAAVERVDRDWKPLARSLLRQVQLVDVEAYHLRGRASLALMAKTGELGLRGRTVRDAKRILRKKLPYTFGFGWLMLASIDALSGRNRGALEKLSAAEAAFTEASMRPYLAACSWRKGQLLGDDALVVAARSSLAAMGAQNPDRLLEVLAPGFPRQQRRLQKPPS